MLTQPHLILTLMNKDSETPPEPHAAVHLDISIAISSRFVSSVKNSITGKLFGFRAESGIIVDLGAAISFCPAWLTLHSQPITC